MILKTSVMALIDFQNDIVLYISGMAIRIRDPFFLKNIRNPKSEFQCQIRILRIRILFFSQHKYLNFKIFISYKNVCKM